MQLRLGTSELLYRDICTCTVYLHSKSLFLQVYPSRPITEDNALWFFYNKRQ